MRRCRGPTQRTQSGALAFAIFAGACSAEPRLLDLTPEPPVAPIASDASLQASPRPSDHDYRTPSQRDSTPPFSFDHLSFDAEWIPAMWVTADVDQSGALGTRGDLDTGSGMLLRAGMGSTQQNIGLLYMGTWHDEKTTGRGATTQSLLLDFLYRAPIADMNDVVWFEVDAGLGGTELRFDSSQFDSQVTGSALLHGDLEFRITRAFTIAAGLGGFIWGVPGDTVAYGSYITLGAKLIF